MKTFLFFFICIQFIYVNRAFGSHSEATRIPLSADSAKSEYNPIHDTRKNVDVHKDNGKTSTQFDAFVRAHGGYNVSWSVARNLVFINIVYYIFLVSEDEYCTGTIIDSTHVLTSAHCFPSRSNYVYARAYITPGRNAHNKKLYVSKSVRMTPRYAKSYFQYDIAIIELEEALPKIYGSVRLPGPNYKPPNFRVFYAVGFCSYGSTHPEKIATETKKRLGNSTVCENKLKNKLEDIGDPKQYLCSKASGYSPPHNSYSCRRDTGGPLFLKNRGYILQVGVKLRNIGFSAKSDFSWYSSLPYFMSAIREYRNGNYTKWYKFD